MCFAKVRNRCNFVMEGKIDQITALLNTVVTDVSSVKATIAVHDKLIKDSLKSGQVDGSLSSASPQSGGLDDNTASSVFDRVSSTYSLGAGSVFSPQATGYAAHEESTPGTSSNNELQLQYKSVKTQCRKSDCHQV